MLRAVDAIDPLVPAALLLAADEFDPDDLRRRFAATGAALEPEVIDRLLVRMRDLGLVRVARASSAGPRYVTTTLGRDAVIQSVAGVPSASLEALERLRTDLVSTIAHELRTPLTAIRTSAGLLASPDVPPSPTQQRTLVDTIERNVERMHRLIEDVLDLTRFRAGSIRLQLRRFSACELAESAVAAVAAVAARRRVVIEVRCETSVEIFCDHRRLEQALVNLVSNAQRFSSPGETVTVGVTLGGDAVEWTVEDRGPGIAEDDRARLFDRFFVGRGGRTTSHEGVGLGLPIALAVAQAHGGSIDVHSRPGEGASFVLRVPVDGPPEPDA
jgi:signal transduction histidine kinase